MFSQLIVVLNHELLDSCWMETVEFVVLCDYHYVQHSERYFA